jgi:hypothetical protein
MKATIRVVEAVVTMKDEIKRKNDVFDLTNVEKNVQSTIFEV